MIEIIAFGIIALAAVVVCVVMVILRGTEGKLQQTREKLVMAESRLESSEDQVARIRRDLEHELDRGMRNDAFINGMRSQLARDKQMIETRYSGPHLDPESFEMRGEQPPTAWERLMQDDA